MTRPEVFLFFKAAGVSLSGCLRGVTALSDSDTLVFFLFALHPNPGSKQGCWNESYDQCMEMWMTLSMQWLIIID